MRHIVLEGIDASGKSTLAKELQRVLYWPIQHSEGPPKYPGEMNVRLTNYAMFTSPYIFDRHPVVSQSIYGTMRSHSDEMHPSLISEFYRGEPIFIYCDPINRGMTAHQRNTVIDTDEHLRQVNENYSRLLALYRDWAIRHAHLIYRIGDNVFHLIHAVKGMLYEEARSYAGSR